ncbi:MAG: penicillin-binding protein 2 [Flavobacteriaceae bacterium]|nr:penicillin-binding protein 2 [Flavobacteriaceae bacterium]
MRRFFLHGLILFSAVVFVAKLVQIQLLDNSYELIANNISIKKVYDFPERGYIYDRNGTLLVSNQPSYDIMVIPREVKAIDSIEFSKLLKIKPEDYSQMLSKAKHYSLDLPSVFVPQLSKEDFAALQEKMWKFEGFYIQKRSLRDYQTRHAANILGYIAEVNEAKIAQNKYYQMGDLIGIQGVEKAYEDELRGIKGVKRFQKDRLNRIISSFKEGMYDTLPSQGKDLELTIDIDLQSYGEMLMQNKRGGIVAIEPKTGEILALVNAPSYDPALLVGRERSRNFTKLYYDTIAKPLYDRGLLAEYPPGSTFKILNALIALQEGVVSEDTKVYCHNGYFYARGSFMKCHSHASPVNLDSGIYNSCNAYFGTVYTRTLEKFATPQLGIDNWAKHVKSFGLGDFLGYDLPTGKKGLVPTSAYYDRAYPNGNWRPVATVSNGIGQGELLTTPVQLANFTAAIANRGYYYTPHIIRKIEGKKIDVPEYTEKKTTTIDPKHFEPVIEGMFNVFEKGTGRSVRVEGIEICGKTGTAENFTKIDGKRVQLTDHSIFIAFAPKDDPKIAIAVFVENGYWGARWAGPIASLMIQKHLNDTISRKDLEKRMLEGSLLYEYEKPLSGEPFNINQ